MDDGGTVTCSVINDHTVHCNGTDYNSSTKYAPGSTWFWIYLSIYVALVILAGRSNSLHPGVVS